MSNGQKTNERDAMSLLSTYMLQGWVMTDGRCQVPDCPVPIMRSKDGSIRFCVVHDPLPTASAQSSQKQQKPTPRAQSSPLPPQKAHQERPTQDDRTKNLSIDKVDEAQLRREQSSRASKLIGEKLLQRWALLNDICPNPDCYAIPLMRDLNRRVVCVVCGQILLTEEQAAALVAPATVPASQEKKVPSPSAMEEDLAAPAISEQQQQQQKQQQKRVQLVSGKTTGSTIYSTFADAIAQKLHDLTDRMTLCQNPVELKQLFEAIEAGVSALEECEQLSK